MNFSEQERAFFAALADVLIPDSESAPSASKADVGGPWLDAVLAARPDLASGLKSLLQESLKRPPREVIDDLRVNDSAAFEILAEAVPGAYFMNPEVQQEIHYQGQMAQPIDPRPDYMEDGLLESVIRRGPIYRPTPPSPGQGSAKP